MFIGFGFENLGFLFTFGDEHSRFLFALGLQDLFAAFALGTHLLFHGFLDILRRHDVLKLHTVDLDAPRVGGFIEDGAHFGVDNVARGKRLVEFKVTDDVAQCGCRQIFDSDHGMLHAVGIQLRVGNLIIDDRINLHMHVIAGDNRLRRKIEHLLL